MLFFEIFGSNFYHKFKFSAKDKGLQNLYELINQIEEDEKRHIFGIRILLLNQINKIKISFLDKIYIKTILSIVMLDLNMSKLAIHNYNVRKNVTKIGLDPEKMNQISYKTSKQILNYLKIKAVKDLSKNKESISC